MFGLVETYFKGKRFNTNHLVIPIDSPCDSYRFTLCFLLNYLALLISLR